MGIFDKLRGEHIRIHIVIRGKLGDADKETTDEHVRVPAGTTLGKLVAVTDSAGIPLREALDQSSDLIELLVNGTVCPFIENAERELVDGDEIYVHVTDGIE